MEYKYPLLVTELNVDGCGTNVNEMLMLDHDPTRDDIERLEKALAEAKKKCAENEWSTSDMVEYAAKKVFRKHYTMIRFSTVEF